MAIERINRDDAAAMSADVVAQNVAKLRELFPEIVTEGATGGGGYAVNVDVLKQLVGDRTLTDADEKYGLNWHGKRAARQLALTSSLGTLRPCPDESVDWANTRNLVIEGDNLEVLKLLQKSYAGRVKLIYIDPPYNTGNDFVYPDDFKDGIGNYLKLTGQTGDEGAKLASNTESSGRFHTAWLNMMLPRLKTARSLLTKDGAIFVSCDETEHARLRLAMDDIFGGENFIADMVWAAGRKNDSRLISVSHEYIVCYARDAGHLTTEKVEWRQRKKGLDDIYRRYDQLKVQHGTDYGAMTAGMKVWFKGLPDSHPAKAHKHYNHIDSRGVFFPADISWPGGGGPTYVVLHPNTNKPVKIPARGWITPDPAKMKAWIGESRVHFGEDESKVPCLKAYLKDQEHQAPYSVFYQDGRAATKRLRDLMDEACFDFPKDETVLQEIIEMLTANEDVVVDFFAGSGTTGHAVMAQNAVDGGSRRYILVQLPEPLDPENNNQKAAAEFCDKLGKPRNIAELTKERLRRAGTKVKADNPQWKGDAGFRVFKLDSSNIRAWDPDPDKLENALFNAVDNIKPERSDQDVLYEFLLKTGVDLCAPIETSEIAGKQVHSIGQGKLLVCLDRELKRVDIEPLCLGIAQWSGRLKPDETACVFRDNAFENDIAKTNAVEILKQHGITNVRSI